MEWERAAAASALPDPAAELALDSAGNPLVTGRRWEGGWAAVLVKHSPTGTSLLDVYYPVSSGVCTVVPISYPALVMDASDNIDGDRGECAAYLRDGPYLERRERES